MISKHIINNSYFYVDETKENISISYSSNKNDMIKIKKKYDTNVHLNIFHLFLHYIELKNLEKEILHKIQLDVLYNGILVDVEKNIQYIKDEYTNNNGFYYQDFHKDKLTKFIQNGLLYFIEDESFIINWYYGEKKHEMKVSVFMKDLKKEVFSKKINLTYLNTEIENLFIITLLLLIEMDEKLKNDNINYNFKNSFIIYQKDFLKTNLLEF